MTNILFLEFDSQEQKEKLIFLDDQRLLQRVVRSNLGTYFFSWKIHVGLWEKFVGIQKVTGKYPTHAPEKIREYLRLFAEVLRLTTSI